MRSLRLTPAKRSSRARQGKGAAANRLRLLPPGAVIAGLLVSIGLWTASPILAQDVLLGLTSAGGAGPNSPGDAPYGGTVFSLKSTGADFAVQKAFIPSAAYPAGSLVRGSDNYFYGMTTGGGSNGDGTIFRLVPNGALTVIRHLHSRTTGSRPQGSLVQGPDGSFYGMTYDGGSNLQGTVFKVTPAGALTVLHHFAFATTGGMPSGSLVVGSDGNFYGMTGTGGASGRGTVFKITPAGALTVLHHFNYATTGAYPEGSLVRGRDGNFYGMTSQGGAGGGYQGGTIFKITPAGTLTVLRHLVTPADGGSPKGGLVQASDGYFYGMTTSGGVEDYGTLFKISATGAFSVLHHMNPGEEGIPYRGHLVIGNDGNFYGMAPGVGSYGGGTVFRMTPAGTLSVIHHFNPPTDGASPHGSLLLGRDGDFYGMTSEGGRGGRGTIFRISPAGTFAAFKHFPESALAYKPMGSLVQGRDGHYYGMTSQGGAYGLGCVFKMCNGSFKVLRSLSYTTGANPEGSLVQGSDGNFYGMAKTGGTGGYGTIFRITPAGTLTVLRNLDCPTTGCRPEGSLVPGSDGNFYGMTQAGGASSADGSYGYGTIFKITPGGTLTVLRHFGSHPDGANPSGDLTPGSDGNFYGMTTKGGSMNLGAIFRITPAGTYTVLKQLDYLTTGRLPYGSLVQGKDGNFYGLTSEGGTNNHGTVFRITPTGTMTLLFQFHNPTTGGNPRGSLVQGSDGNFYGTTSRGGTSGYDFGTIFKITPAGVFTVLRHLDRTAGAMPEGNLVVQKANPKATAQSVSTPEDTPRTITLAGTGGSPLTYTLVSPPKYGTLTGTGTTRTYTPNPNFAGTDAFAFTVTWGCQTSLPATVTLSVTPVNDAPVLATLGNKTVTRGTTLSFTAAATDPDAGQTKTFSLVSAPAGASIGAATGAFSWTPAATGTYTFVVKVTDNGAPALSDSETIAVTVTAPAPARRPAGAEEDAGALRVSLYPNPVADQLTVLASGAGRIRGAAVTDAGGNVQFINRHRLTEASSTGGEPAWRLQLDVSALRPGLYLLRVESDGEHQVVKFLKQ